jgi:hypothetical protein
LALWTFASRSGSYIIYVYPKNASMLEVRKMPATKTRLAAMRTSTFVISVNVVWLVVSSVAFASVLYVP